MTETATTNGSDDWTPIERILTELRKTDCDEAFAALGSAFDTLADVLAESLERPDVRAALAKAVRASAAQLREDAVLARHAAEPAMADNFLQTLAKAELTRRAMRLEERTAELERTAAVLERQSGPGGDSPKSGA